MSKKVLYNADRFDVIEKDGRMGIEPHDLTVAVLPFTRDGRGLPGQLGVLKEYNRIWSAETITIITGKAVGEDPDILAAATRKLFERSSLDVQEPERWYFLGFLRTHKSVNQEMPCFACDITGLSLPEPDDPAGEEDEDEGSKKPEFVLLNVNHALDTDDSLIPAVFMKVFKYIFGFGASDETDNIAAPVQEDPKQKDVMEIAGVLGAGKKKGAWEVHVKKDSDTVSIKSKVQEIVGEDTPVNVTVTAEADEIANTDKE